MNHGMSYQQSVVAVAAGMGLRPIMIERDGQCLFAFAVVLIERNTDASGYRTERYRPATAADLA